MHMFGNRAVCVSNYFGDMQAILLHLCKASLEGSCLHVRALHFDLLLINKANVEYVLGVMLQESMSGTGQYAQGSHFMSLKK